MLGHNKWSKAIIMLIVGLLLIYINNSYPQYVWTLVGVLVILKAIMIATMPSCCEEKKGRK